MRLEFAVLQNNSSLKGTCEPEGCKKETLTFLTRSKLDQYYFYWSIWFCYPAWKKLTPTRLKIQPKSSWETLILGSWKFALRKTVVQEH